MGKVIDLGAARIVLGEIEGEESNNCISHVKEYGYCMAERLGFFEKEREKSAEKRRKLFRALKESGYADKEILSAYPELQD